MKSLTDASVAPAAATAYGHAYLESFDASQSSAGSESTLFGHLYQTRVAATLEATRPLPTGSRIVDLGCAQGNIARKLADVGFNVTAVESNPDFLDYAEARDIDGRVAWVLSDIRAYHPEEQFDGAILTEVIEHTGKPAELVEAVARFIRPGGLLILSTPNGERIRQGLPTFSSWLADPNAARDALFGPGGEHHQFLFTRTELQGVLAKHFVQIRCQPLSSAVQNNHTAWLLKSQIGRAILDAIERIVLGTPLDRWLCNGWLVSAYRRSTTG